MNRMLTKRYIAIVGGVIGIILLSLLFIPNNTQRLIKAVEKNDAKTVKELLDCGVDPNRTNLKLSKFWSLFEMHAKRPLTVACEQGNLQIVQYLIDAGATAEYIEGTGWSPLQTTLFYYQSEDLQIVKLLLDHGANPNENEEDYMLPVFAAASMTPKVYDPQKQNGTVFCTGYDQKTAEGITEIVLTLLGDNSVDITNDYGQTLLMVAIRQENIDLMEHLLDLGCDISIKDQSGRTALDYARETENRVIIERLMSCSGMI